MRDLEQLRDWTCQILGHLHFLETVHGLIHHNISTRTVFFNPSIAQSQGPSLYLMHWHLYSMTGNGQDVDFPIGRPSYLAPETILEDSISHKVPR